MSVCVYLKKKKKIFFCPTPSNYRISHSFPLTITQYNPEDGNVNFWEVYISVDTAKLIKRKIKCPFEDASSPYKICYGIDGCIFFMNNKCEVFQVIYSGNSLFRKPDVVMPIILQIYPASNKCTQIVDASTDDLEFRTHINWYKGGLIIAGCDGCIRVSVRHDFRFPV